MREKTKRMEKKIKARRVNSAKSKKTQRVRGQGWFRFG